MLPISVGEVAEDSDLRSRSAEAHPVIPAPPILVPPQWRAARVLDAEVARYPTEVIGAHGVPDGLHATLRVQQKPDGCVAPAQWQQGVVRPRAAWIAWPEQQSIDIRPKLLRFALGKESPDHHEPVAGESRLSRFGLGRNLPVAAARRTHSTAYRCPYHPDRGTGELRSSSAGKYCCASAKPPNSTTV